MDVFSWMIPGHMGNMAWKIAPDRCIPIAGYSPDVGWFLYERPWESPWDLGLESLGHRVPDGDRWVNAYVRQLSAKRLPVVRW